MSTIGGRVPIQIYGALDEAEAALEELDGEGVFSSISRERMVSDPERESELDTEAIDYHATVLKTSLEAIADQLSSHAFPEAAESLTIDELLARFVRHGWVDRHVVSVAAAIVESLGTTSSDGERGSTLGRDCRLEQIQQLLKVLRTFAKKLYNTDRKPPDQP